jgi:hypothetical protein
MDLDDLKADWARRDQMLIDSLDRGAALAREALTELHLARLRRHGAMSAAGLLLLWIPFLIGFGAFLAAHFGDWKFFVPALLLDAWTIVVGVITLRERAALLAVDFGRPPMEIQQRLAALRVERASAFKWAFLTGQVVWWIPFAIVLFKGVLGVDLYTVSAFMPKFMALNVLGGVIFIPLSLAAGRLVRPWLAGSPISRFVIDALTGRDMAEARALAERIARFEQPAAA